MLDFYLIVADYRSAYRKRWLAIANRLIPPNVFYFEHDGLAAKYAVLSEADFQRECGAGAATASVFARFAQPSRLAWTAGAAATNIAVAAVAKAAPTLLGLTRPSMTDDEARDVLAIWRKAFRFTYGAEIRAERNTRPEAILDWDVERYSRFAAAAGYPGDRNYSQAQRRASEKGWRQFQGRGKLVSILRLIKASFTFNGGAEYIAWKINRHAGTRIELKPWQRRHPLLAGISLLPRLLKSGAIR